MRTTQGCSGVQKGAMRGKTQPHPAPGQEERMPTVDTTIHHEEYSTTNKDHSYIITFFSTCFILPLGVIFFCYGKLLRKLRKVSHGRLATARKPERQVTRMVIVMIVAFMVGWTPYAIFSILVTIHPTIKLDPRLASIPAFFSKTAAVYNPIIYVFMNKQLLQLMSSYPSMHANPWASSDLGRHPDYKTLSEFQ
ncbi:hypothetical protein WMY93_018295 [Mugilogobius chulae]|uniref:G-protein coupled receptors family 1 profile domain-containing protein n=1 Tax=Mugilogobius chulae TaxID=88201 RepID=A0AAW0NQA8_9GOBI